MNLIPLPTHAANDPPSLRLTLSERVAVQQGPWFRALPAAAQEAMLAQTAPQHLPAGATLGSRGIARNDWFVVTRGSVRLGGVFANGKAFALRFMQPGEWFGQLSAADDLPSVLDTMAQTDCAVLAIRNASMRRLVTQHPALLPALLQICNDEQACLGVMSGHERKTLRLSARTGHMCTGCSLSLACSKQTRSP
jgi:CRP-like cAMP-binding protein